MEALIYHFKIGMGEIENPATEVYHAVDGANGELGFYLITDGGRSPFRLHFRRPSFINYQSYPDLIVGGFLSDAIFTMISINVMVGELEARSEELRVGIECVITCKYQMSKYNLK